MKVGVISDLHSNLYKKIGINLLDELKNYFIENKDIETLLIAGDITENVDETIKFVKDLKEIIGINVYYVPGNHDLWQNEKIEIPTEKIIEKYIADQNCVTGKVIRLKDDVVLIGDTGWYDYSFGNNEKFSVKDFEIGILGERTWQDKIKVKFDKNDKEKHKEILHELIIKLEENKDKKIIFMTHMLNHSEFKVNPENREEWNFFNAFLGSEDYYELSKKYKPLVCISGHVHYRKSFIENGTEFICSCLGYHKEFEKNRGKMTVYENIKNSMKVVVI